MVVKVSRSVSDCDSDVDTSKGRGGLDTTWSHTAQMHMHSNRVTPLPPHRKMERHGLV